MSFSRSMKRLTKKDRQAVLAIRTTLLMLQDDAFAPRLASHKLKVEGGVSPTPPGVIRLEPRLGIIYWTFSQLISYGVLPWVLFVAIAFTAACLLRGPGIFLGHILVALAVVVLDVLWIQSEMRKPGWDPNVGPDPDFVFMIAVVLRIVLINTVLLPVSCFALRLRRSRQSENRPLEQAGPTT